MKHNLAIINDYVCCIYCNPLWLKENEEGSGYLYRIEVVYERIGACNHCLGTYIEPIPWVELGIDD